jgi:glycosyltransferase involved in cell wall biosynthesis
MKLTVLMPCLNEVETLSICIKRAQALLENHGIDGEILISDNGSTDGSRQLALSLGARVIHCPIKGYGEALQFGIENARGEFVLMGDSDDSYHFDEAYPMVVSLMNGADVCMGSRLMGDIRPGAMSFLNRYLGNPILTKIGKVLFKTKTSDFHCGMRAFRRDKVLATGLVTTGMEWASEMVIKAIFAGLKVVETPITLHKDGRNLTAMDFVGNWGYGVTLPKRYFTIKSFHDICSSLGLSITRCDVGIRLYVGLPVLKHLLRPNWQFFAVMTANPPDSLQPQRRTFV